MIDSNPSRTLEHHLSKNMSKSSKSHHQAGASAANLAFGIDHILSSSSASPMKQVQQAMASFTHQNHFNLQQQQHHSGQQQMNQYHQQQQQAAAMQLMFNSARMPTSTSAPGAPSQQDLFNSAALNEQLALLAAASQHQQQQQQSLLNPAALAAAAQAQQQLQWQYQQQQLMTAAAAAAAAANQQRQQAATNPLNTLSSLGALSSLNALAAAQNQNLSATNPATNQTTENNSPAANHLFSCFMASMLLQQRQQQAQKETSQHQGTPLDQQHAHANAMLSNQISSFMPAPGVLSHLGASSDTPAAQHQNHHRSPSSSTTSTNSPIKQFLPDKGSPSILDQQHDSNSLQRFTSRIGTGSPLSSAHTNSNRQPGQANQGNLTSDRKTNNKSLNGFRADQHRATSSSSSALVAARSAKSSSTNNDATDADDECGTALSSLSNFVSKSLAPILDEFNNNSQKQRTSAAQRLLMSNSHQQRISNKNNSIHSSGSESSMIDDDANNNSNGNRKSSLQNGPAAESNILSAVASAFKGAGSANPIAETKTINTAIARAPPELVQKQPAWVFCTRYSDRPSSGPRTRRAKSKDKKPRDTKMSADEKRPRTAFTSEQLEKLRLEFQENSYLDEKRRKSLADRLCLNENQIKIWFQNKRAKMKKQSNQPNPLRGLLVAGGLYNHSTATSDCSESYANGQADDVGNRRMRDFDAEPADEAAADDATPPAASTNSDDEHEHLDENRHQTASNQQPVRKVNHSIENLNRDQLDDKRLTGGHNNEPLKRPRPSDDGDDPLRNNNSPCDSLLKRARSDHPERKLEMAGAADSPRSEPYDEDPVISVS